MRIGVDVRPLQLQHRVRGIGMHAKSLVVELIENSDPDDELVFYMYPHLPDPVAAFHLKEGKPYKALYLKNYRESFRFLPGVLTASIALIRRVLTPLPHHLMQECDVLLSFDFMNGMPRKRSVRYVLVGYDLIPLLYRRDYFPSFRANLRGAGLMHALHSGVVTQLYIMALRLIRKRKYRILSISESTKEHFVKLAHIDPSLIRTVYLGNPLSSTSFVMDSTQLKRVKRYKKGSFILFIGGNDPRRRLDDVVAAFNQLRGRGQKMKLVFAGFDFQNLDTIVSFKTRKAIEYSSYRADIDFLGFISDSEKKYLYENALCFVFPSICEGFGLPILEAMQEHCPVIAYDYPLSSMAEVAGDAAIMIKPGMDNVYEALTDLINDGGLHHELVDKGLKNSARFSWEKCATETIRLLKDSSF